MIRTAERPARQPLFPGNYEPLPLTSEKRPLRVLNTVTAEVPEGSEKWVDHKVDQVEFPDRSVGWYHRALVLHGAMLAHIDDNDEIALARTFRHTIGRDSVEFPGGGVDENEASLAGVVEPDKAAILVRLAKEQKVSILDLLTPEQCEEALKRAAIREHGEEVGWEPDISTVERIVEGPVIGGMGHSGQTHNLFFGYDGQAVPQKHDQGEQGILDVRRFSVTDAAEMVRFEIVDEPTIIGVMGLAMMYGVKPSWMPSARRDRKHIG